MLDAGQTAELADMFRLMGEGSRLRIVFACLGEPVCVSDIAERLGLSDSLVSHHLRLLRAARLLQRQRRGRQIFYSVADEHIRCVLFDMVDHVIEQQDEDDDA